MGALLPPPVCAETDAPPPPPKPPHCRDVEPGPVGPAHAEVARLLTSVVSHVSPEAPRTVQTSPCGTFAAVADAEVRPGRGAAVASLRRRVAWLGAEVVADGVVGDVAVLAVVCEEENPAEVLAGAVDDYLGPAVVVTGGPA